MRLLFSLLFISAAAVAQDSDRYDQAVPHQAIKFSPGHLLINYHPTVEFAYEQRIAHRWTIQGEYGQIVNLQGTYRENRIEDAWDSDRKGFKAKLEARYYVYATHRARFVWYSAGELYYNNINYKKQMITYEYYDDAKDALYEKNYRQRVYHEEKGLSGKFGFLWNMGPVLLDVNGGLCYRFIHYSKILPAFDLDDDSFFEFSNDETSRDEAGLVLGVRVGYRFSWRRSE